MFDQLRRVLKVLIPRAGGRLAGRDAREPAELKNKSLQKEKRAG